MNFGAIKHCDIANGPGCRVSLFVSGCTHHCKGCFQPETWNFGYGKPYGAETLQHILHLLRPNYISGLSILGGEPMESSNMTEVFELIDAAKVMFPKKTVWLYSGYTLEELMLRTDEKGKLTKAILNRLDILVDGPFIEAQKNIGLQFRGSENQRIIDLRKTREAERIVLWDGKE